jgi:putative transcriptional regulator
MAANLKDISGITSTDAAFILESRKDLNSIDGIPVVHNWEMCELKDPKDFIKLIRERKDN